MENIKKQLKCDKIKINWNKKPIEMEMFLSFLTVPVIRSTDHLGSSNGWTRLENEEIKLVISGGITNGKEWLDMIQYGEKLANQYNNFVNPFYLFDIMNDEGKRFFVSYYNEEIQKILSDKDATVKYYENELAKSKQESEELTEEAKYLYGI